MLPLLAVLLFAVLGISALVVDAGLAFTTQAQLEATARTLALEHARVRAEGSLDPDSWDVERRKLEAILLGPGAVESEWHDDPERDDDDVLGGLERDVQVELSQRVPLRFGFAALLPVEVDADGGVVDGLSVRDLLAARAAEGPDAPPTSGGLRATGFEPKSTLRVRDQPALRVGEAQPTLGLPGLAGIALREGFEDRALAGSLALEDDMLRVSDGACVGWTIDATQGGAAVGEPLVTVERTQIEWTSPLPLQVYVPLARGECATGAPSGIEIVAFLDLRLDAGGVLVESDVPTARNASARPAPNGPGKPTAHDCGGTLPLLCLPAFASETP